MVETAAYRSDFSGRAIDIGICMTSGGIGKKDESAKLIAISHLSALGRAARARVQS